MSGPPWFCDVCKEINHASLLWSKINPGRRGDDRKASAIGSNDIYIFGEGAGELIP